MPAYVDLADLSRATGHDDEAERWLLEASRVAPNNAEVVFALGLLRVRQHRAEEALQLLARAAQLSDVPHYAYAHGVALYARGRTAQGLRVLRPGHERFPANRELLLGLASLTAASGDVAAARRYAESSIAMAPTDPRGHELLEQLPPAAP